MTGSATASRLARRLGGEICPVALDVLLVEADENISFHGKVFTPSLFRAALTPGSQDNIALK